MSEWSTALTAAYEKKGITGEAAAAMVSDWTGARDKGEANLSQAIATISSWDYKPPPKSGGGAESTTERAAREAANAASAASVDQNKDYQTKHDVLKTVLDATDQATASITATPTETQTSNVWANTKNKNIVYDETDTDVINPVRNYYLGLDTAGNAGGESGMEAVAAAMQAGGLSRQQHQTNILGQLTGRKALDDVYESLPAANLKNQDRPPYWNTGERDVSTFTGATEDIHAAYYNQAEHFGGNWESFRSDLLEGEQGQEKADYTNLIDEEGNVYTTPEDYIRKFYTMPYDEPPPEKCPDGSDPPCEGDKCADGSDPPCDDGPKCADGSDPPCDDGPGTGTDGCPEGFSRGSDGKCYKTNTEKGMTVSQDQTQLTEPESDIPEHAGQRAAKQELDATAEGIDTTPNQLKIGAYQAYTGGDSARGVRLKRTEAFKTGAAATGTKQLTRKKKFNPLNI